MTLTNAEKGFSRAANTNDNGTFSFPAIQPGIYRLDIEMNGFKKIVQTEVRAIVDTPIYAEAIEEFRVTTSGANASQGRSSGAQISLVTKSGTNNLRGAIFLTGRRTRQTLRRTSPPLPPGKARRAVCSLF